ncbi:M48 family metallopeptidase [Thalassospira alkalitolerans]|uniref:M48 family metallopeptidase n=1 Tax=Thalassospira alkalitolerans TaxID=1293890 RepID=UPI003AA7C3D4
MKKSYIPLFAVAFALAGCVTNQTGIDLPFLSSIPDEGKYIDTVAVPEIKPFSAEEIHQAKLEVLANSKGIAPLGGLQDYAQTVLDKIIATSPEPTRSVKVYLLANASAGAMALPENMIFLHHSVFNYLQSEDQLAFVLAHEYSHVILQHNPDSLLRSLRPYLVTAVDVAVSRSGGGDQTRKAFQLYGSDILTRDLLLPVWDRADEREADHMGVDLMVRAGYNPTEADRFFEVLDKYEQQYDNLFQDTRNQLEKQLSAEFDATQKNNDNALLNQVLTEFSDALTSLQDKFADRHGEAKERAEAIFAYNMREYSAMRRTSVQTQNFTNLVKENRDILHKYDVANGIMAALQKEDENIDFRALEKEARIAVSGDTSTHPYVRWAFANLREKQGERKKAIQNINLVKSEDYLPLPFEIKRAVLQDSLGETDIAVSRIEAVAAYYNWPIEAYEFLYPRVKQSGNSVRANELVMGCTVRYPQQRALCSGMRGN